MGFTLDWSILLKTVLKSVWDGGVLLGEKAVEKYINIKKEENANEEAGFNLL